MLGGTRLLTAGLLCAVLLGSVARASPWAEVGDGQLRSDIEILAAAGAIDDITMQWPLPWAGVVRRLNNQSLAGQPAYVRAAADRVRWMAEQEMQSGDIHASAIIDATNSAAVVRGYDALGREDIQGSVSAEYIGSTTAVRLSLGAQTINHPGATTLVFDNSYIAQKIGGMVVYAGFMPHWWGPGWVSSLSFSNNAQPMPQIGIARVGTEPFQSPWLSWLGPWQFEFIVGVLDGPRIARNTGYVATRVAINPIPHLEIGFSRTTELCGTGHVCVPFRYFSSGAQTIASPDETNDEASFDFKYSSVFEGWPYQIYMQIMNEDNGPFVQSASSHLFGTSVFVPVGADNPLRLTFEYTDSIATANFFSFGKVDHGTAYTNSAGYLDGMRYRDRTLGFSLDGDSRLLTVEGSWLDHHGWSYRVSYHRARVSDPLNTSVNVVTTAPVTINVGEVRWSVPFRNMRFELAGRLQDDQPRPHHGFQAAAELAITYNF